MRRRYGRRPRGVRGRSPGAIAGRREPRRCRRGRCRNRRHPPCPRSRHNPACRSAGSPRHGTPARERSAAEGRASADRRRAGSAPLPCRRPAYRRLSPRAGRSRERGAPGPRPPAGRGSPRGSAPDRARSSAGLLAQWPSNARSPRVHNRQSVREPQGPRREGDAVYTRRHALALALLSVAAIVAGACGPTGPSGGTTTQPTAAASKAPVASMRVAILADEGTLTPFCCMFGYPGQQMMCLNYDTLMLPDAENLPKPLLAREVKTSADGATYDVTLRTGVKWHDGKPLTNEDVKFSFEYILKTTRAAFRTPIRTVESITLTGTEGLSIKLTT